MIPGGAVCSLAGVGQRVSAPDLEGPADVVAAQQLRSARLLFDAELASGLVSDRALENPVVRRAVRMHEVPARPLRVAEQLRRKLGGLDYEGSVAAPFLEARREVLGEYAAPPRLLVRVDEFPHAHAWDDPESFGVAQYARFHEIMRGAGVPYLVAVLPRVSREPLAPAGTDSRPLEGPELEMLRRVAGEGVSFGLHGLDHRTRHTSPRRHSELCGLTPTQTEQLLDKGLEELGRHDIHPNVFVPPYNRFDADQYALLARRFEVVGGGPESIGLMGFQRTPLWRGDAVYLPSYEPFYGKAQELLSPVARIAESAAGLWVPVVLHWGWEAEAGWRELERLASMIAPYAVAWDEFLKAVTRSREGSRSAKTGAGTGAGAGIGAGAEPRQSPSVGTES
jgi:peptidoglycan/xylan/chitin deacetylase (PgdA/CDA1 family)